MHARERKRENDLNSNLIRIGVEKRVSHRGMRGRHRGNN